jgi:hypothetical protein
MPVALVYRAGDVGECGSRGGDNSEFALADRDDYARGNAV